MKNQVMKLTLLSLIINCSAAYARSSAYDADGWVSGFYSGQDAALESVPLPVTPEPVEPEALEPEPPAETPGPADGELAGPKTVPADYDAATALRLARNAKNNSIGAFTGWCYSYVADAMELTGIIRRDQWYSLGIGVNAAADFAAWANRNPGTLRSQLKLAKMETPAKASDLPMGAIVVYNRGVCGFSGRSGHIEVKVAPDLLCSDGCQPAYQECFGPAGARAGISVYVPVKKAAPQQDDIALAGAAVREVRLLGLRSPSEIKMVMKGIAPGSPQEELLPALKAQYDASLKDLLALREEFDKEFSWGHNPGFDYLAGRMRELALKYKAGNCTEQAFLAQAYLRSRGVEARMVVLQTFDWWTKDLVPDKSHVFVVFGLPEGANAANPGEWGPDAVIADPWGRLAGPAQESLRRMLDDIFRLDQSHEKPRYFVLDYEHPARTGQLP